MQMFHRFGMPMPSKGPATDGRDQHERFFSGGSPVAATRNKPLRAALTLGYSLLGGRHEESYCCRHSGVYGRRSFCADERSGCRHVHDPKPGCPYQGRQQFHRGSGEIPDRSRGLTDISGLMKDKDGIWHGKASKAGSMVTVNMDYQGNITVN
jgi:hypothetical protein